MKRIISVFLALAILISMNIVFPDTSIKAYGTTIRHHVSVVKISRNSITLMVGKTYKLSARVTPSYADNKNVTWKSSNKKIATVNSSGIVKALKKGVAVIYVHTVDGNKIASCKVTIKNYEVDARYYLVMPNNEKASKTDLIKAKNGLTKRLNSKFIHGELLSVSVTGCYIRVRIPKKSELLAFAKTTLSALQKIAKINLVTFQEVDSSKVDRNGDYKPTGKIILTGADIKSATANLNVMTETPQVTIILNANGTRKFAAATARLIGRPIAIFVGNKLISAPTVEAQITNGNASITSVGSLEETQVLANSLMSGALGYKVSVAVIKG